MEIKSLSEQNPVIREEAVESLAQQIKQYFDEVGEVDAEVLFPTFAEKFQVPISDVRLAMARVVLAFNGGFVRKA